MKNGTPGKRLGEAVVRHPWLFIILPVALFVLAASGGRFLTFSSNARVFFGKDNPQLKAMEKLENIYSKDDNVLIAIAPKDGNVFTPRTLAVVEELTAKCWQIPYSSRVDSLSNFQHTRVEEDDLIVEDLVSDALNLTPPQLEYIRKVALAEPALVNRLVSPTGHVAGISILFRLAEHKSLAPQEIAKAVRALVAEVDQNHPELDIYLTGGIMIDNAFAEASEDDMKTLVPMMFAMMILVMGFTLRAASGTFVAVLIIFMSAIAAVGAAGWIGIVMTPPSALAPTIILTLAVADSVHLLVTMLHEMRKGMTKREAIVESMRLNMQPVFLTSITTAIGFMSMNSSDVPPFHDLGNIVAIGVMAAFFLSITLLPAMMAVLPVRIGRVQNANHPWLDRYSEFVIRNQKRMLWGMTALIVVLVSGIAMIDLNDLYLDYFDKRYSFRNDTDFIEKNLAGISLVEYSIPAGEEGGISKPEYLDGLDRFTKWLRLQPEVKQVSGLADIMKQLNRNMHEDRPEYYRVPDSRELGAQYLLLYEMSLPFGLDLNNMINVDKSATRLRIGLKGIYNREIRAFEKRATNWLKENTPSYMHADGTGISMMFAYINQRNVISMLSGTFIALVVISGILMLALRSLKIGMISLVPNLVPAFMAFGLWGMTVQQVGLAVSVVAAMSLGIVVDDTIHFLSKYLRARREHGMSAEDAIRYSFNHVGRALIITSVILIAGFSILSLSGFKINANMGILTAAAIAFALIADFMLLPALLLKVDADTK